MKRGKPAVSSMVSAVGVAVCIAIAAVAAFSEEEYESPPVPPPDTLPCRQPKPREDNLVGDAYNRIITRPFIRFFTLSGYYRRVSGDKVEAKDVDAFGRVHNSSWFTNRISTGAMTVDELVRGPDTGEGPDTAGEWTVLHATSFGATRGFSIRDRRGDRYILKFDPPGYPELSTGAEMISTKIFHAAGYNVPENYLVAFDPARIRVGENVTFTPRRGKPRAMTAADLDSILRPLDRLPDEKLRILASKYIDGIPLGGWRYHGTRPDDPNDLIPHEHRRELRGLRVIAGWVDNFDNVLSNTPDFYDPKKRYVQHWYCDFNNTFGSYTTGPKPPVRGHQMVFKMTSFIGAFITGGFYTKDWETYDTMPYLSVGNWESKTFKPQEFKFSLQSEAFDNMTYEDAFWAAAVVMSFTDSVIAALTRTGRYSNPEAGRYIGRVLAERRDTIGRYYYSKVNPLDGFRLERGRDGGFELRFTDRAVEGGLEKAAGSRYRYRFSGGRDAKEFSTASNRIPFAASDLSFSDSIAAVRIRTVRASAGASNGKELLAFIGRRHGKELALIGIRRN